jgi:hypothetical protein
MTFEQFATDHGLTLEASSIPFRSGPGFDSWESDKPGAGLRFMGIGQARSRAASLRLHAPQS